MKVRKQKKIKVHFNHDTLGPDQRDTVVTGPDQMNTVIIGHDQMDTVIIGPDQMDTIIIIIIIIIPSPPPIPSLSRFVLLLVFALGSFLHGTVYLTSSRKEK